VLQLGVGAACGRGRAAALALVLAAGFEERPVVGTRSAWIAADAAGAALAAAPELLLVTNPG